MAEEEEYPFGTPQEHALICRKHNSMPIDFICEDCEEFVCTKCVKEDHKDHNWDTITTAATLKSRGLLKTLTKIEEEDIQEIDEKIEKVSIQMEENKKRCEQEVSRIQRQYDAMVGKLDKIRKQQEKALGDSLTSKNADLSQVRSGLEEKKKKVLQSVKSFRKNSSKMTDITLLKTHQDLTKLLSTKKIYTPLSEFSSRYECGDFSEETLKSMMGQNIDYEKITLNNSISCLSPSGSVSIPFSTDPLAPDGICQTQDGGLLVTLEDTETDIYQPKSHSRRLVRHVTLTGDIIREYEYQEDGQTRLFTWPSMVKQNANNDICVINWKNKTNGDLVILFNAGTLKSSTPARNRKGNFIQQT
uniref:Transcription intermediary factor 1-alpha-like n=1 Tax=Crassostrea virginica TaxID=6565 RepID=A0A8B8D4T3_CRAVI|nr:transcription intermediary factor 1-alpha-like [Crassostrea virginica]